MTLTKEYFDKGLSNILEKIADVKTGMASKDDLTSLDAKLTAKMDAQTIELKHYTAEAFETQQEWMDERFKELIVQYDVRERVEKLEKQVARLSLNRPAHA